MIAAQEVAELRECARRCREQAERMRASGSSLLADSLLAMAHDHEHRADWREWYDEKIIARQAAEDARAALPVAPTADTRSEPPGAANDDDAATSTLRAVACDALATATLAAPAFVVDRILPRRHVTLLGGHGGVGKSTLALAIAAHVAAGTPWNGLHVAQGRVLVVSLEDDAGLAMLRLRRACEAYRLDAAAVGANVTILDGNAVRDTALVRDTIADGQRKTIGTGALAQVQRAARGCALVVIDSASDAFHGREIDRSEVSRFMRTLRAAVAVPTGAAVLLLGHVDKSGARVGTAGNSYSGSTAWHNAARSRLALLDVDGAIELRHEKSNLGRRIDPVSLRRDDAGVLVPAGAQTGADALLREQADADAIHAAMLAAEAQGVTVSASRTGPATAQHALATFPELPDTLRGSKGRARFWAGMAVLLRDGRAGSEEFTDGSRHRRRRFVARVPA